MKPRKETSIENAFTIETIVAVYHLRLSEYSQAETKAENEGVSYDFWQLLYLDSGHFSCYIGQNMYTLRPGQLLFCEPEKIRLPLHQQKAIVGFVSFRCNSKKMDYFKNKVFNLSDEERNNLSHILTIGVEKFKVIPEEEQYFGQQPMDGTTDYDLQSIKNRLELLLIDLYKSEKTTQKTTPAPQNQINYYDQQFHQIEDFLISRLNQSLTIGDISAHTGFSVSTIKRIYSRHIGCGPIYYFLTLKINEAKRLIRETDMSLTQIAETLGFSSIHYFSRIFKKRTGVSPRQYAGSVLKN